MRRINIMEYHIYGTQACGYCIQAKKLLTSKEKDWVYIDLLDTSAQEQKELQDIAGIKFRTVPQIFLVNNGVVDKYIGGYTNLVSYLEDNE
jgi:glutaredoxin